MKSFSKKSINDFISKKVSGNLPKSSSIPGVTSSEMHHWLPTFMSENISQGLKQAGQKMKGFLTNEAIMVGVESRTSSPVRIPRHQETLEHLQVTNLFPCGEGAGYSGGIVSSAIDGERCAEAAAKKILL